MIDKIDKKRKSAYNESDFFLFFYVVMGKKSPSGLSLIKQQHPLGKNRANPAWTHAFLDRVLSENREGTDPLDKEIKI